MDKLNNLDNHLDRFDDRYITTKAAIYFIGAIIPFILGFVIWVFMTLAEGKTETELSKLGRNQQTQEMINFYNFHKDRMDILQQNATKLEEKLDQIEKTLKTR